MSKKKKIRVEMRKNRSRPPRQNDFTRDFQEGSEKSTDHQTGERVRAKGELSRRRTIIQDAATPSTGSAPGTTSVEMPAAGMARGLLSGRVIRVHGLWSVVETEEGRQFRCAIRRLLKTLATDERNVLTTGDLVQFRPSQGSESGPEAPQGEPASMPEGLIERIEPRHGLLTRASRRREHVLVANVDQLVIVMALVEPKLKRHLIDRYIACAHHGDLTPIICLNKADLVDPAEYQSLIGEYSQLGYEAFLTSAVSGAGLSRLRSLMRGRATVFSGQSGVGKSSLLNALQPDLGLRVKEVSDVNQKGQHTTTTAELIRLECGGWVVDTPGLRQLQLWNIASEEVEGYFREFHAYVSLCAFPDCTHTHETGCAVKAAVERHQISEHRYFSYLGLFSGD